MKGYKYISEITELLKECEGVEEVELNENITNRRFEFYLEVDGVYFCICITERCFEDNKIEVIFNKIKDVMSNKLFKHEFYTTILSNLNLSQEHF